jgi:hypothetical protein
VLRPMRRAQMDASALSVQESASQADRTKLAAGQPAR